MSEANKELMRRVYDEIFNGKNHELVRELYCEDCVGLDPALGKSLPGHDELIALLEGYRNAFPNHYYEILDMVAEGEKIVVNWRVCADETEIMPQFSIEALAVCTIQHGKVHTVYQHWDDLSFLKVLGAVDDNVSIPMAIEARFKDA